MWRFNGFPCLGLTASCCPLTWLAVSDWMPSWCRHGPCACCRYRAHFRWEHYQHQLAQQMDLPDETEACASVTSAFLQVTSLLVALALVFNSVLA